MDTYEKKYKDALERARNIRFGDPNSATANVVCEEIFPELKESEDEKMRKNIKIALMSMEDNLSVFYSTHHTSQKELLAWLEKQDPKKHEEELEKAYKCADEVQYRKGYEDAKHELEKECNNNDVAKGILRDAAINLIVWIDYNKAEGNMCLSNMECKDIEDALISGDWDKIYTYIKKKLEKQGKQKLIDSYCEEHCKGFQETVKCYADGECKAKRDAKQKPAWSEEDEKWIDRACMLLDELNHLETLTLAKIPHNVDEIINHIKSLKNRVQPHWKPTDEQLDELVYAIDNLENNRIKDALQSLYNDLKKL